MLNIIWIAFFVSAFLMALYRALFLGDAMVWTELVNAVFASSKTAFSIALNLTGILCFWLGLLKIAEASGATGLLARALYPLFRRIMPGVPAESPALSSMIMNIAANMLGLDNAATPMGLKAMEQLQQLTPNKDTASRLGISIRTVEKHINLAIRQIKTALASELRLKVSDLTIFLNSD